MQNSPLLLLVRNLSAFLRQIWLEGSQRTLQPALGVQKCCCAHCLLSHWQCSPVSWNDDCAFASLSVQYFFYKFWDTVSYKEQATIPQGPHSSHLLQSHLRLYWLKPEAMLLICLRADAWPCVDVSKLATRGSLWYCRLLVIFVGQL